ncbi:DUF333 domain-containing protein [Halobacteriovorax sp. DPLXC-1]|uniref:DUF333 domain-containing protein n=1 Tax=unclassified Halobacteriovorax TaxID=2639665 RepID=UPI002FF2550D
MFKMIILSTFTIFFTFDLFAKDFQIMKIYEKDKFKEVKIYKEGSGKNTVFMNDTCKKSKDCLKRRVKQKKTRGLAGHPGSKACKAIGNSEYKILKMENGNQIGFCRFSDGSMISAWSLLRD